MQPPSPVGPPLYSNEDSDRWVVEPPQGAQSESYRAEYRRDYARLIHSAAFRRLQGKTQLFPNHESDFFRNRLTHSLEVAQIAKSIAIRLNSTEKFFVGRAIDTDLVETAALAHDLGHPPFGHNGEEALDECMAKFGGFEGNAQTLRILSKLEKKRTRGSAFRTVDESGQDLRAGLNLTARTLAAVLKYDREIPRERKNRKRVEKGYYYTEAEVVRFAKERVLKGYDAPAAGKFKSIECAIMDIADDIAYSTYDIEDAMKGGLTTAIEMIAAPPACLESVAETVAKRLAEFYGDLPAETRQFSPKNARDTLLRIFGALFELSSDEVADLVKAAPASESFLKNVDLLGFLVASRYELSRQVANVGYLRTQVTSDLVGRFVRAVEFLPNVAIPPLSRVRLSVEAFKEVETLKVFAYENLINSARLKLAEFSGKGIVATIFRMVHEDERGHLLLPEDFRDLYTKLKAPDEKARVVCDFVAGMTDRYAIEFYGRLTSPDKTNFWKPL